MVMSTSTPLVGCLPKKDFLRGGGGSWALQNPLATPLLVCRGKLLIRECEGCTGKECSKVAGNDLQ